MGCTIGWTVFFTVDLGAAFMIPWIYLEARCSFWLAWTLFWIENSVLCFLFRTCCTVTHWTLL